MTRNSIKSHHRQLCLTLGSVLVLASASACATGFEGDTAAVCGNGALETGVGETCDDGNLLDGDGCDALCQVESGPVCGNGILESPEECDAGEDNGELSASPCRTDCTVPFCGDGVLDPHEECDDGLANSDTEADACRTDCREPFCGDTVLDADEQCDPPSTSESASISDPVCCGDCTRGPCSELAD